MPIVISKRLDESRARELVSATSDTGLPLDVLSGVKQIKLTILPGVGRHTIISGLYNNGRISLSYDVNSRDSFCVNFVHEVGHHVDFELYDIAKWPDVAEEYRDVHGHVAGEKVFGSSPREYVAVGFELFYSGDKSQLDAFRRLNPKLYQAIRGLHEKHS